MLENNFRFFEQAHELIHLQIRLKFINQIYDDSKSIFVLIYSDSILEVFSINSVLKILVKVLGKICSKVFLVDLHARS